MKWETSWQSICGSMGLRQEGHGVMEVLASSCTVSSCVILYHLVSIYETKEIVKAAGPVFCRSKRLQNSQRFCKHSNVHRNAHHVTGLPETPCNLAPQHLRSPRHVELPASSAYPAELTTKIPRYFKYQVRC